MPAKTARPGACAPQRRQTACCGAALATTTWPIHGRSWSGARGEHRHRHTDTSTQTRTHTKLNICWTWLVCPPVGGLLCKQAKSHCERGRRISAAPTEIPGGRNMVSLHRELQIVTGEHVCPKRRIRADLTSSGRNWSKSKVAPSMGEFARNRSNSPKSGQHRQKSAQIVLNLVFMALKLVEVARNWSKSLKSWQTSPESGPKRSNCSTSPKIDRFRRDLNDIFPNVLESPENGRPPPNRLHSGQNSTDERHCSLVKVCVAESRIGLRM